MPRKKTTSYNGKVKIPVKIIKGRRKTKLIAREKEPSPILFELSWKKAGILALGLALFVSQIHLLSAFESHVINITAHICSYSETRTQGYWKNHPGVYESYLPQNLGDEIIDTIDEVEDVFDANNSIMRNKLKKQLLAMKFNLAHFGIGGFFIEGEGKTIAEIVAEADDLLRADPPPSNMILEEMKNLLDYLNNLHQISYCAVRSCVSEVTVIYPNGAETWYMVPDPWAKEGFGIYPIQWQATNPVGADSDLLIDIWYCKKSGDDCFYQIADDTENDGEYFWHIPYDEAFVGSDARIKVIATNSTNLSCHGWDISDRDFCPPLIDFTSLSQEEIDALEATYTGPKEAIGDEASGEEPATFINSYPEIATTFPDATFVFSSEVDNVFFQCKINKQNWVNCSSPHFYSGLEPGDYQFQVFATDEKGNYDKSPAVYSWTVESAPETPAEESILEEEPVDEEMPIEELPIKEATSTEESLMEEPQIEEFIPEPEPELEPELELPSEPNPATTSENIEPENNEPVNE